MRIAIDYRVMSTEAADRGMGRYTQRQLKETLKLDRENEYVLALFPECRIDLIDREIRGAENVSLKRLSLPILGEGIFGVSENGVLKFSAEFQDWLVDENIDLYHATTPFLPPVVPQIDACPFVATLYDVIPLVFPQEYFGNSDRYRSNYAEYIRGLQLVKRADRLIAISESARRDAITYLGYTPDLCTVAYPAVESTFQPKPQATIEKVLRGLAERAPIPEAFILSVTGMHHSKNAAALLEAHQLLLSREREHTLPLVLVLPSRAAYDIFSATLEGVDRLLLLYAVSDEELCGLYSAATLVVHPSRYEGFGYPVAEAMSCGTPVITTTSSSLREVGGDAAVLVDPTSPPRIADAISALVQSPSRREEMRERGLLQARRFGPDQLGHATVEAYGRAAAQQDGRGRKSTKRRLAIWSSLPPLKCGVGDYTAELLDSLSALADVEIFVGDGYIPDPTLTGRHHVHHFSAFERREGQQPFDSILYQMGGTFMQEFMYETLQRRPGIVVLHDLLMGPGIYFIHRTREALGEFRNTIVAAEGDLAAAAYDRIVRKADGGDPTNEVNKLFTMHYLLGWIVRTSLGQIVHMEAAKAEIEERYAGARVSVVDMGVADPLRRKSPGDVGLVRWRYGLRSSGFLLGIFGSVVPVKRLEVCLEALAQLRSGGVDCELAIVGDQSDPIYMARVYDVIEHLGLADCVHIFGRVERRVFDELLIAVDAVLNLRYPSLKGMSAILLRALAAGKPVVVSDIPEWRYLPTACCWPVAPDEREAANVALRIKDLATDREMYEEASREARQFYVRRGTLEHMAKQYLGTVERVLVQSEADIGAKSV